MVDLLKNKELEKRIKTAKKALKKGDGSTSVFAKSKLNLFVDLFSGVMVGAFLGYFIDKYFGTLPLFLFICTILGCMGGFYNFYKDYTKQLNLSKK